MSRQPQKEPTGSAARSLVVTAFLVLLAVVPVTVLVVLATMQDDGSPAGTGSETATATAPATVSATATPPSPGATAAPSRTLAAATSSPSPTATPSPTVLPTATPIPSPTRPTPTVSPSPAATATATPSPRPTATPTLRPPTVAPTATAQLPAPPAVPAGFRSTWSLARTSAAWDGQYTWTLTWNAVPGAAGYEVHLGEPGGPWAKPINVPGTTFSGKWSATSTPLCAEVRAYNAGGQSAYSGALCLPDRVPPPPSGVTAVIVGQCPSSPSLPYVSVSWTDTSDIEEYFVIRVRNPDLTPGINRLGAYFSSPQAICGGPAPACYSVVARNGAGDSDLSNEVCLAP